MDNMFTQRTVFDLNTFELNAAYMLSFSTCLTNRDELRPIFSNYMDAALVCGMSDRDRRLPQNTIEFIRTDWMNRVGILVGMTFDELTFIVPEFSRHTSDPPSVTDVVPLMRIPISAFMDDELRGAPVKIQKMQVMPDNTEGD